MTLSTLMQCFKDVRASVNVFASGHHNATKIHIPNLEFFPPSHEHHTQSKLAQDIQTLYFI